MHGDGLAPSDTGELHPRCVVDSEFYACVELGMAMSLAAYNLSPMRASLQMQAAQGPWRKAGLVCLALVLLVRSFG